MFTDILQPTHLLIVLVIALLVLGPKRLPVAGRALGQGLRELKQSVMGEHRDDQDAVQASIPSKETTPVP